MHGETVKFTVSSVYPSVRPTVRTQQLGSHKTDFHKTLYEYLKNPVDKIQV